VLVRGKTAIDGRVRPKARADLNPPGSVQPRTFLERV